jgi:hypothetical protein
MAKCPYCKTILTGIFRNKLGGKQDNKYGDLIGSCKKCLCGFALQPKINK